MTMLSIISAGTAIVLGAAAGQYKSKKLKMRADHLLEFCSILRDIEIEIRCNKTEIFKIIEKFSYRYDFFNNIAASLAEAVSNSDNKAFDKIWADEVEQLALSEDDKKIILSVGKSLGKSDAEGQAAMLAGNSQHLSANLDIARQEYEKKGKMYRRIGTLIGLLIAIVIV